MDILYAYSSNIAMVVTVSDVYKCESTHLVKALSPPAALNILKIQEQQMCES